MNRTTRLLRFVRWRQTVSDEPFHAYQKSTGGKWFRLCDDKEWVGPIWADRPRPEPVMRCAKCDCVEMKLHGVDESVP